MRLIMARSGLAPDRVNEKHNFCWLYVLGIGIGMYLGETGVGFIVERLYSNK